MTRPPIRLLHIVPVFYPAVAFGGPIWSIKAITDGVAAEPDFNVEVMVSDNADPNAAERLVLPENPLILPPGYPVRFCRSWPKGTSISVEMLRRLPGAIRAADVVHLSGSYNFCVMPTLILCRLFGKPLVWSPRGGFQATAQWQDAPKRRVKEAFEKLAGWLHPRGTILHTTAEIEAETSRRNLGEVTDAVIPNAIDIPQNGPEREWRPDGRLRLAFLSRVHPKKGLELLIPALAELPEHVTLDIYGDGDAAYVDSLRARIAELGLKDRVAFHGHVDGAAKSAAFTSCDLFVLPTHSENFGIVVAEALAHGTPVVTTEGAPWAGLESEECGRWTAISTEALRDAIARLDTADLAAMGAHGRDWMTRDFSTAGMVRQFADLYRRAAGRTD